MNNTPQSVTPRTDEYMNAPHTMNAYRKLLKFTRTLERDLNEANKKLDLISNDKNYVGGTQYWISKHDELAVMVAELAKQNHMFREALVIAKDFESENENGFFSFKNTLAYEQAMSPNLSSLAVLSRAEIESWPCKCFDRSGNNSNDVGIIKCIKHILLERFTK